MRKTLVATLALFISLMVLSPAQAVQVGPRQHHGTHTQAVGAGGCTVFVSVTNNTNDSAPWGGRLEGLVFHNGTSDGCAAVTYWQVDYIHQYENGNFMNGVNRSEWFVGHDDHYSTDWDTCYTGRNYRTVTRVRVKNTRTDTIGAWEKFDSNVWTAGSYCVS